jgi:hypothetical protein
MAEAEFISELLLAMQEGIRAGNKQVIDKCYKDYDDAFPDRKTHEKRFRETVDIIGGISGGDLSRLKFRATRLFYPLFCAVFHSKFGLPRLGVTRASFRGTDYPKLKMSLEGINELIDRIETAKKANETLDLSAEERKFYDAYTVHWVHADKRTVLTEFISKQMVKALRD